MAVAQTQQHIDEVGLHACVEHIKNIEQGARNSCSEGSFHVGNYNKNRQKESMGLGWLCTRSMDTRSQAHRELTTG